MQRAPHLLGRKRHVELEHPERIEHGVHHRRRRADGAELAAPFDAEKVGLARHALVEAGAHRRQVGRARHGVVHERAGEELAALRIVDRPLAQRLSGALRDAAVHLPLDDHHVDDAPNVVAARDARHLHLARLAIDLHLAHLRTVRPGRRRGRLGRGHEQHAPFLPCGKLAELDRAIGAGDAEAAVAVLEVRRGSLQRLGSQPPAFDDQPPPGRRPPSSLPSPTPPRPPAPPAEPPTNAEREPTLPTPLARSVSPCTIFTFAAGTPSTSVTSCVYEVSSPCPIAWVPEKTVISPCPLTSMSTVSVGSAPVHSRYTDRPRPRSRPARSDACLRAG